MGQILQRMGYCRTGHVVVATRDDLVGQYVGHTAPKTKEVIKKAMGGVLLIDEAYYLFNAGNDRDYGQESIEILLNVMEKQQEDLIVVLAGNWSRVQCISCPVSEFMCSCTRPFDSVPGYKDRMDTFFSFIPGMSSRIGNHVDFPDYEVDELVGIAEVRHCSAIWTIVRNTLAQLMSCFGLPAGDDSRFAIRNGAGCIRNVQELHRETQDHALLLQRAHGRGIVRVGCSAF